jgi:hypothetical protein
VNEPRSDTGAAGGASIAGRGFSWARADPPTSRRRKALTRPTIRGRIRRTAETLSPNNVEVKLGACLLLEIREMAAAESTVR